MTTKTDPTPDLGRFEQLQAELDRALAKLEDPNVPLQRRLAVHAEAAGLLRVLEATLEKAREGVTEAAPPPGPGPDPDFPEGPEEPYESVRDRLEKTVGELAREDLPLARVVALRRKAERLAAHCETILGGVREELERATRGAESPAPEDEGDPFADGPPF